LARLQAKSKAKSIRLKNKIHVLTNIGWFFKNPKNHQFLVFETKSESANLKERTA
jgi:hypothetical protein